MKQAHDKATHPGIVSEAKVRVRYAETDQMGVAYHGNYFIWFEVGRSQYCNDCGFSYRELEGQHGLYLIVADAHCRYKTSAKYEDELTITTFVKELTRRTIRFGYEIHRADGVKVATGETLHILINKENRPTSFPDGFLEMLRGETVNS